MRTAYEQITKALIEKGYHAGKSMPLKKSHAHQSEFEYWSNGTTQLLIEKHHDGGYQLFTPLTSSISIADDIEAIPTTKRIA